MQSSYIGNKSYQRSTPIPINNNYSQDQLFQEALNKHQNSKYHDALNLYNRILNIARSILTNNSPFREGFIDITDGATFYHADYVTPGWAKTKQRTVEIEDHIFYKWKAK